MVEAATVTIVWVGFPYHTQTPIAELRTPGPPLTGRSPTRTPGHPPGRAFAFCAMASAGSAITAPPRKAHRTAPLPLRIVTWNINSLRLRLDNVTRIAETLAPDVL